jgi:dienelactone hydrolase
MNSKLKIGLFAGLVFLLAIMLPAKTTRADMKTQTISYQEGRTTFQGYLAYDDSITGPRPGVLIFPEWWGLTDYPKHRAEQLAKLGYIAFAVDMYGNGQTTDDAQQAGQLMTPIEQDRSLVRARASAGLDVLRKQPQCDPTKIAAIGYCFGGLVALELARSGADLSAIVSFHGNLTNPNPDRDANIKPKILICTGGDDAFVPPQQVQDFQSEMKKAGADVQVIVYKGAHHAFTNPDADRHGIPNIAYNAEADKRSFQVMIDLFNKCWGPPAGAK